MMKSLINNLEEALEVSISFYSQQLKEPIEKGDMVATLYLTQEFNKLYGEE